MTTDLVPHATKFTSDVQEEFLAHLSRYGNVSKAADAVKMDRAYLYRLKRDHPESEFAQRWKEACELGVEAVEDEARRRAYEGYNRPVYQGGKLVGHEVVYSDAILMRLLEAHKPDVYRTRLSHEHAAPGGGPLASIAVVATNSKDALAAYKELANAAMPMLPAPGDETQT